MVITFILVTCYSRLDLIYVIRVLCCKLYLNKHLQVIQNTLYRLRLLVFDGSFVSKVISIKFDPLRSSGLSSVKFDLLLDWLNMNNMVGEMSLRFYRGL
jgi:hypothetical protein